MISLPLPPPATPSHVRTCLALLSRNDALLCGGAGRAAVQILPRCGDHECYPAGATRPHPPTRPHPHAPTPPPTQSSAARDGRSRLGVQHAPQCLCPVCVALRVRQLRPVVSLSVDMWGDPDDAVAALPADPVATAVFVGRLHALCTSGVASRSDIVYLAQVVHGHFMVRGSVSAWGSCRVCV
jgi:hypothetical protein